MTSTFYRVYLLPWDLATEDESRFREILKRAAIATLVLALLLSPSCRYLTVTAIPRGRCHPARPPRTGEAGSAAPVVQPVEQKKTEPEVQPNPSRRRAVVNWTRVRNNAEPFATFVNVRDAPGCCRSPISWLRSVTTKALSTITSGGTAYTGAVGGATGRAFADHISRAGAGSAAINTTAMSRDTGGAGLGGRATTKVSSGVAALGGSFRQPDTGGARVREISAVPAAARDRDGVRPRQGCDLRALQSGTAPTRRCRASSC